MNRPLAASHPSIDQPDSPMPRGLVLVEVLLVLAVFFVQGAVPVPDVNESYYLGKAIHYWNPDWIRGDSFLESKDSHTVFYFTFGWLSLWLSPTVLAWTGRVLTWGLLAWAWRRLSLAVVPRRWFCVLSAALLVCLIERCHMAGEWLVGGVEAKGFAFVLVLLGLEAMVRGRFNRVWLLLGAASAFHVLVGGWSVVAAAAAWLLSSKDRLPLRSMWPALLGGFLLSLPGLIPALMLNWGTDAETVRQAHEIYVFERLAHHLDPAQIRPIYLCRFVALIALWLVMCRMTPAGPPERRLRTFVIAAVGIAVAGALIRLVGCYDRDLAAGLLRFYWFRLADVAVPMGVAIGAASLVVLAVRTQPVLGRICLGLAVTIAGLHVGEHLVQAFSPMPPPADRSTHYAAWRRVCDWIAQSGQIPRDARFITPSATQTFKWYAGRSEVANWKEVPQDAEAIVRWRQRMKDLWARGLDPNGKLRPTLSAQEAASRLQRLSATADYVIAVADPPLPLDVVYREDGPDRGTSYTVYRLGGDR